MIASQQGIESIKVSLADKEALVRYRPDRLTPDKIAEQIYDMGFDAFVKTINSKPLEKPKEELQQPRNGKTATFDNEDDPKLEKVQLHVKGMTCASCVAAIEKHVQKIKGLFGFGFALVLTLFLLGCRKILVSLLAARAEVHYDPSLTTSFEIANSITDLGFPASVLKQGGAGISEVDLEIKGMTCASCVHKIETHVAKLPGVQSAKVALTTNRGRFGYDPEVTGPRSIIEAIER